MQVTETSAEGLKREYKVVIPAAQVADKVDEKLKEVGQQVNLPGFRPGKIPQSILKQRFGSSVMGEVLEQMVNESASKTITDNELRPALQPNIEIDKFDDGDDLEYTMKIEVLPEIAMMDFKSIKVEKLKVPIKDDEIDDALERIAMSRGEAEAAPKDHKAADGDVVVIDFAGKVDGELFDGGSADDYELGLGTNSFIPGFEDQLIGTKAGDKKVVKVTFPEEYGAENLAGKDAEFDVTVKEVKFSKPAKIDDELAKGVGLEDLNGLKDAIRNDIQGNYEGVSRARLKRDLMDALDEGHNFEVPPGMLDTEYEAILKQYEERKEKDQLDEEEKSKSEDDLKAEYKTIADRRVRLGLVLSEVGAKNNIEVTQEELQRAIMAEAQRMPGQERQVFEFFQKNEDARNNLRAPLYEEKVVDYILELATVTDKEVSVDELLADPDEEAKSDKKASAGKEKEAKAKKTKPKKKAEKKEK